MGRIRLHSWQPDMRVASAVGLATLCGLVGGVIGSWVFTLGADEPYTPPVEALIIAMALFGTVRVSTTALAVERLGPIRAQGLGVLAGLVVGTIVLAASMQEPEGSVPRLAFVVALVTGALVSGLWERALARWSRPPPEGTDQAAFQALLSVAGLLAMINWWTAESGGIPVTVLVVIGSTFVLMAAAIELDERKRRGSPTPADR